MASTSGAGRNTGASAVTFVFAPVSHPILESIDPMEISKFLKARRLYVGKVKEKKKKEPAMTNSASFKLSIDMKLLKIYFL